MPCTRAADLQIEATLRDVEHLDDLQSLHMRCTMFAVKVGFLHFLQLPLSFVAFVRTVFVGDAGRSAFEACVDGFDFFFDGKGFVSRFPPKSNNRSDIISGGNPDGRV